MVFFITVAALSCLSSPGFNFEGEWEGHRQLDRPGVNPAAVYTLGWVVLKVRGSRFELESGGMPSTGTITGGGNQIVLHTDSFMQKPLEMQAGNPDKNHPEIRVTGQADGTVLFDDPSSKGLYDDPKAAEIDRLSLHRKSKPSP